MKIVRTLMAAASLAAFATASALAQHGHGGGGGFRGGGGFHGGGSFHGGGGWHGGGWHGGYRGGWYGGRGWGGWYAGDAFALGLLGGYALSPWDYGYYPGGYAYSYDYAPPPPPPPSAYYDRGSSAEVYDGSDMQQAPASQSNGQHCPLYWNDKTNRYEPHCG